MPAKPFYQATIYSIFYYCLFEFAVKLQTQVHQEQYTPNHLFRSCKRQHDFCIIDFWEPDKLKIFGIAPDITTPQNELLTSASCQKIHDDLENRRGRWQIKNSCRVVQFKPWHGLGRIRGQCRIWTGTSARRLTHQCVTNFVGKKK